MHTVRQSRQNYREQRNFILDKYAFQRSCGAKYAS